MVQFNKKRNVRKIIQKTCAFIAICALVTLGNKSISTKTALKNKKVTIFVHGTLLPGLSLLNPYKTYTQTISPDDWYCKCLAQMRKNPLIHEDSIILQEGLHKIDPLLIEQYQAKILSPELSKKAAYQAIGAYETLAQLHAQEPQQRDYYTFGFPGTLSDIHRKEAGHAFYEELYTLVKNYQRIGYYPEITICAYSHGGNVTLYLADAENQMRKNIVIDTLVLLGTPIQIETAPFAAHALFKKVFSFYSQADAIQVYDTVSIPSGASHHMLSEILNTAYIAKKYSDKRICDIRLLSHTNPDFFGHFEFWFFNRYTIMPQAEHNKANAICHALSPLPIAILVPTILSTLEMAFAQLSPTATLDISLHATENTFIIHAIDPSTEHIIASSPDIGPILKVLRDYAIESWQSHTTSSETFKAGIGFLTALQTLGS